MNFLSEIETLSVLCVLCLLLLTAWYKYLTWNYDFWVKQGVAGDKPQLFIGTFKPVWKMGPEVQDVDAIKKYGRTVGGFEFRTPVLITSDPDLLKRITVRDFHTFSNRRYFNLFDEMNKGLSNLRDEEWKQMRSLVTPAFTSGKLKQMVELIETCIKDFIHHVSKIESKGDSLEIKSQVSFLTIDVIASIAFGLKLNSLKDNNNEFCNRALKAFSPPPFIDYAAVLWPSIFSTMKYFVKNPLKYFADIANTTIDRRIKNKEFQRKDFLQVLIDSEMNINEADQSTKKILTRDKIVAQVITFLLAGQDTTATTISFTAYCLATHPDIQEKLIEEVDEVMTKDKGEITYEGVMSMQYLEMVLSESLRLFPPVTRVDRQCNVDNTEIDGIKLRKGVLVILAIFALHRDPEFYPNPEEFDPERFSPENKANRNPFTYLPFGTGPRSCVAMRFGLLEAKLTIVHMLSQFRFATCEKTQIPVRIHGTSLGLLRPESINLLLKKRTDKPAFD